MRQHSLVRGGSIHLKIMRMGNTFYSVSVRYYRDEDNQVDKSELELIYLYAHEGSSVTWFRQFKLQNDCLTFAYISGDDKMRFVFVDDNNEVVKIYQFNTGISGIPVTSEVLGCGLEFCFISLIYRVKGSYQIIRAQVSKGKFAYDEYNAAEYDKMFKNINCRLIHTRKKFNFSFLASDGRKLYNMINGRTSSAYTDPIYTSDVICITENHKSGLNFFLRYNGELVSNEGVVGYHVIKYESSDKTTIFLNEDGKLWMYNNTYDLSYKLLASNVINFSLDRMHILIYDAYGDMSYLRLVDDWALFVRSTLQVGISNMGFCSDNPHDIISNSNNSN
jgi:hypothetical protein